MANKVLKALGLGCLGALIIACLGFSYVIYQDTLIHWWRPVVLSLTIAIGSGKFLWKSWRRLTDTEAIWVNYGVHTATVAALLIGIFFIGNYFLGDRSCITYQDVTITRVYREKHYHTKRISRRVYGRGSSYWVYKADVELPGRDSKDIRITEKRYDKRRHAGVGCKTRFLWSDGYRHRKHQISNQKQKIAEEIAWKA